MVATLPARATADADCRLGVLAFGDSITYGGGGMQWGVALQSWALWLARGLGLPYTGYAVNGAAAHDVLDQQIPAFERVGPGPEARFDVGCLYIGVNDVRRFDWSQETFAHFHGPALRYLTERCSRTLAVTAPLDLGLPRAGRKVQDLNAVIEGHATRAGALLVDLSDFRARNHMMADRVHPTALGQIAIAERALDALAADGLRTRLHPASLIDYETTWRGRLRGDFDYVYRSARELASALAYYVRERP
jgi:lysophospholipase L1-like esterase